MEINIILDLNDLCQLISGGEVRCKTQSGTVVLASEQDIAARTCMISRSIGRLEGSHKVTVDGREYVDKIAFQTHLEEQVIHFMKGEACEK